MPPARVPPQPSPDALSSCLAPASWAPGERLAARLALLALEALRLQLVEGAGPVGGAQGRSGRASHRKGAEVLGGEGDHIGRLV